MWFGLIWYDGYGRAQRELGVISYYNSSSVCLCVCLCVCSLPPPRSFSEKVNGSLSLSTILYMRQPHAIQLQKAPFALLLLLQSLIQRLLLHCISTVYVGGPRNFPWGVLFLKGQRVKRVDGSHFDGVCRWTSQLTLRGSGRRVNGFFFGKVNGSKRGNGSTSQRVTFTFTILYIIADDARLTPPRCKKHMAYDDSRLTPHHCKKHTTSFASSTGKFPSYGKKQWNYNLMMKLLYFWWRE